MSTYEKIVKGATKVKLAAPKTKYIDPILQSTYNERGDDFRVVMRTLGNRIKDSAWTVSYKALVVVHILMRDGARDVALEYLTHSPRILEVKLAGSAQAVGLQRYSKYLYTRVVQFKKTGIDHVRFKTKQGGRLRGLTVDKGLLRECESVLAQIGALLRCKFHEGEIDNDITLTAFRLLASDLLTLYQVLNEGVINVLEHYFEMSKVDAEHALEVYKEFTEQTTRVVSYLKVAKHMEERTKVYVPSIKHAPTSLTQSLETYLNDPDFEINRRQYLAEKQARESSMAGKREQSPAAPDQPQRPNRQQAQAQGQAQAQAQAQNQNQNQAQAQQQPADLIDLFSGGPVQMQEFVLTDGGMQNAQMTGMQQGWAGAPVAAQQTGYNPFMQQAQAQAQPQQPQQSFQGQFQPMSYQQQQQFQPQAQAQAQAQAHQQQFQQFQPQMAGMQNAPTGMQNTQTGQMVNNSPYGQPQQQFPQYSQQQQQPAQLQQTPTGNPFRHSISGPAQIQGQITGQGTGQIQGQITGHTTGEPTNPFAKRASTMPVLQENATAVQPQRTGMNPFSRQATGARASTNSDQQPLSAQTTGGNPFRQSMFGGPRPTVSGYTPTFGGLENLQTVSVFPQTQQQQQQLPQAQAQAQNQMQMNQHMTGQMQPNQGNYLI